MGAAHYGSSSNGISANGGHISFILFMMLFSGIALVAIFTIGNSILLLSKVNKVVKGIGVVFYGITWLILAAVCFFAYALTYSLNDPNTE